MGTGRTPSNRSIEQVIHEDSVHVKKRQDSIEPKQNNINTTDADTNTNTDARIPSELSSPTNDTRSFFNNVFSSIIPESSGNEPPERPDIISHRRHESTTSYHDNASTISGITSITKETEPEKPAKPVKEYSDETFEDTSFHYATEERDIEFKKLFPNLVDARLLDDYSCNVTKELLYQGRLYVTDKTLCFKGVVTKLELAVSDITFLEKTTTAVFPNSISVETNNGKVTQFNNFNNRDETFNLIKEIWSRMLLDQLNNKDANTPAVAALPHGEEELANELYNVSASELYNTMFEDPDLKFWASFFKRCEDCTDFQIIDPQTEFSYTKPLSYSMGPKSTECFGKHIFLQVGKSGYYSVMQETRTPNVPSGKSFVVRTRYVITPTKNSNEDSKESCNLRVSFDIEWIGSSWIKGVIESSCRTTQVATTQSLLSFITRRLAGEDEEDVKSSESDIRIIEYKRIIEDLQKEVHYIRFLLNTFGIISGIIIILLLRILSKLP